MFNNGAQVVGLTPRPIKSKIIFSISASYQIENNTFYKSPTFVANTNLFTFCTFWDFDFSSVKRYIVACKNSNICLAKHGAEHEGIRTGIRTLEAQIEEKIRTLKLGKMLLVLIKKECNPLMSGVH